MHKPKGGNMPDDIKTSEEIAAEEAAKLAEEEAAKKAAEEDASKDDDVLSEKEKKAISESRKYQKRAQKAEKELEKIQQDKLSDDEKKDLKIKKLEDDNLEAENKLKDSDLDSMILGYASTLGFQNLDDIKMFARQELADEEDVSKADVKSVIDSIVKEKPYLLGDADTTKVGPGNFPGGNQPEGEKSPDEMLRDAMLK